MHRNRKVTSQFWERDADVVVEAFMLAQDLLSCTWAYRISDNPWSLHLAVPVTPSSV